MVKIYRIVTNKEKDKEFNIIIDKINFKIMERIKQINIKTNILLCVLLFNNSLGSQF